ncbi:winged helix-turn-helix domain-containing protein [Thalassomonas actiniarum]|uniref:Winged helix-turn-helix domain-containing protein n=1 Tax=Thalassomonas actiniarum TaxID=485447 RepID=A0AAF0C330_9GAMM|nr:winged helix-turn-helix domain-containing protein [Thalassomonas actiniarum]WDD99172.1 winged helix-turn-helix domain-containing protein [Thalassomonas actiniarum]
MQIINESEIDFSRKIKEVKFGFWSLFPKEQTISDGAVTRELEPLLYSMLCYFITHHDRIISRQELIDNVWQQAYVDDNAINRAISELRKALKSEIQRGHILKTHYRKGYSFLLEIEVVYHPQKNPPTTEPLITTSASQPTAEKVDTDNSEKKPLATKDFSHPKQVKIKYLYVFTCLVIVLTFGVLFKYIYPLATITSDNKIEKKQSLVYSQEILAWEKGTVTIPKLSKNKQLLAYSFMPENGYKDALHIKDMATLKEYKITEHEANVFPVGWSENNDLFYQIFDRSNRCELWQVNLNKHISQAQHKKLFDCNTNNLISGEGINNQLLYTKYNYRNIANLSAIVSRDLTTGNEFQVTSPNIEILGDYFLKISKKKDKILFLRMQAKGSQIYIANIDGSNQSMLFDLDYIIGAVNWSADNAAIFWHAPNQKKLFTYELTSKKLTEEDVNTQYKLGKLYSTDIINKERLIYSTYFHDYNIAKLDLTSEKKELSEYSKTDIVERHVVPYHKSNESIYVVQQGGNSLWHYKDGIKKKIKDLPLYSGKLKTIAISPDDSQILVAWKDRLVIYQLSDFSIKKDVKLDGIIKTASWPLAEKVLLTYTESLKTNAWFYDLQTDNLIKLTNSQLISAQLINENELLFLNTEIQLIKKNIATSHSEPQINFAGQLELIWSANNEHVYYSFDKRIIYKKSLNNKTPAEEVFRLKHSDVEQLHIKSSESGDVLYMTTWKQKNNYLLDLTLKKTQ